eukprot:CAMPEP_0171624850 /NCGR_PEP_ID=MMETSP0990-20121206/18905_1 /TAXON_ID=483369 /ORGANISM="non described non described, Strain CCMP2098" /LENGTH=50 /DNA_ID=CAMNT_0012191559 /DNA_START=167 /DNA_END=320 /DNA_ORIENTATION=-
MFPEFTSRLEAFAGAAAAKEALLGTRLPIEAAGEVAAGAALLRPAPAAAK